MLKHLAFKNLTAFKLFNEIVGNVSFSKNEKELLVEIKEIKLINKNIDKKIFISIYLNNNNKF